MEIILFAPNQHQLYEIQIYSALHSVVRMQCRCAVCIMDSSDSNWLLECVHAEIQFFHATLHDLLYIRE